MLQTVIQVQRRRIQQVRLIECACGCGFILLNKDEDGEKRSYIKGHYPNGRRSISWKGGRRMNYQGYISFYLPNYPRANSRGYVLEHVLVFETYHKCVLLPWGIVHHKDGNKQNNHLENLEGMINLRHHQLHRPVQPRFIEECSCGSEHIIKV